ncbi:uncharacterized protein LOC133038110 [Cannabis sativa]|uniref:uncharacterized protein LOC133038110 n=1 Tax=Cannabis sativa TaxID=3483 RepID=UPI0029CA7EF1|nr:uncharacterized protein LOC133038110 [Cannabis sativa]
MSVFLIPQEVTRDIEGLMSKFWWQSSNNSPKGIYWMSWKKLCKHKSKGGMGFRNLRSFNLALLEKQGCRLLTKPEMLVSRIFKARYYPRGTFFTAEIGNNPSYVWRSVLEARQFLTHGVCWSIGDGISISVLGEPWLPDTQNPFVSSSHPALDGSGWDEDIVADLFDQRDQNLILAIPMHHGHGRDNITWNGSATVDNFWKKFWALKLPPKMKNMPGGETIYHALVVCPAAELCLNRVGIDADQKKFLVALCWSIWNARNDKVWNNKVSSVESDGAEQWQPPHGDSIKVNVDAAIFADTNQFGFGFVVRNSQGLFMEGVTKLFNGSATPEFVEALGVKESWIKRNQPCHAILETDCLVFIQALRSSIEMISMFGQVVNDCKALFKKLKNIIFFIRRSANKVAHKFARASLFYLDCNFNLGSVPVDLLPSLVVEFNG